MFERLLEVHRIVSGDRELSLVEQLNEGLPRNYGYGLGICFDKQGYAMSVR